MLPDFQQLVVELCKREGMYLPNTKFSLSVPGLLALHVHHSQRPELPQLPDQVGELHLCSPQHAAHLLDIILPWFSPHDVLSLVREELISENFWCFMFS